MNEYVTFKKDSFTRSLPFAFYFTISILVGDDLLSDSPSLSDA
jgi:hypothetical protein